MTTEHLPQLGKAGVIINHIPIENDLTENLLIHLEDAIHWIDQSLQADGNVLVHCQRGLSRAPAIVIGYVSNVQRVEYSAALSQIRDSHPEVSVHPSFEKQLRIWHFCTYNIRDASGAEKRPYSVWKAERDELLGRGHEAITRRQTLAIGRLAADIGQRRAKERENEHEVDELATERKGSWKRVEDMEETWRRKLMSGQY